LKRKWVANVFLKARNRLTPDEFHQMVTYSPEDIVAKLANTKHCAWVEIEKIVILRMTDSDREYNNVNIVTVKDTTIKE